MPSAKTLKTYYGLTKPGIIRGNAITAAAGFFLAANGRVDVGLFIAMLAGLSLIIASGCVFNNYIDSDIDARMDRTKNRALVSGRVTGKNALVYATVLGIFGSLILATMINLLALYLALAGLFFYVVVYGFAKRRGAYGTLVGSISGAIPPLVGYGAVSGRLDLAALILFVILVTWQMPHFYAIAMYRLDDYERAGIPVLPAAKGMSITKKRIIFYVQAYLFATLGLSVFGFTGYTYFALATVLGVTWLWLALRGIKARDDKKWAHLMFRFSLLALSLLCLTIYFDRLLP